MSSNSVAEQLAAALAEVVPAGFVVSCREGEVAVKSESTGDIGRAPFARIVGDDQSDDAMEDGIERTLKAVQDFIVRETAEPWPRIPRSTEAAEPEAAVIGGEVQSRYRAGEYTLELRPLRR